MSQSRSTVVCIDKGAAGVDGAVEPSVCFEGPDDDFPDHGNLFDTEVQEALRSETPIKSYRSSRSLISETSLADVISHIAETQDDAPKVTVLKVVVLTSMPFLIASTGLGFQLAKKRSPDIFSLPPLVITFSGIVCVMGIFLATKHDWSQVKLLFASKYLWLSVSGIIAGTRFTLQNIALARIDSSLYFIIMKMSLFYLLIIETAKSRTLPKMMHVLVVSGTVLSCTSFIFRTFDSAAESLNAHGLLAAFGSSVADAFGDKAFEWITTRFKKEADVEDAETIRCILFDAAFKVLFCTLCCFCFEGDGIAQHGFFYGWSYQVFLLAVVPTMIKSPIFLFSVTLCGALATNMAASLDAAVSYLVEVALAWTTFSILAANLIVLLVVVLLASHAHQSGITRELTNQRSSIIRDLSEGAHEGKSTGEKSTESVSVGVGGRVSVDERVMGG